MVKSSVLHLETLLDLQAGPFRQLLEESLQELLEGQMTEFVGAAARERTRARSGYRAGHCNRSLTTRVGTLELRVPRDRARQFSTELLDRYPRSERALISALGQMVVRGSASAKVKAVAEELCGQAFSASTLGRIRQGFDNALARFARRALEEPYQRLVLRARRERVEIDGVVRSRVVLMAIGSNREGRRQVLAVELANRVSRAHWNGVLRRLEQRGLHGVESLAIDDGDRMNKVVRKTGVQRRLAGPRAPVAADAGEDRAPDAVQAHVAPPAVVPTADADRCDLVCAADQQADWRSAPPRAEEWTHSAAPQLEGERDRALHADRSRPSWLLAGLAGALVAAGFLIWGARLTRDAPREPVTVLARSDSAPRRVEPVQALGPPAPVATRPPAAPPASSRLQLSGVVAVQAAEGAGIALIGVDGGSARAFRVGSIVDFGLVLQAVKSDSATLGPAGGPATVLLEVVAAVPGSHTVLQAGAGRTSPLMAGALPPTPGETEATQPAPSIADSMLPTTADAGAVQVTAFADFVPAAVPVGQAASAEPTPGERRRLRRLNRP
jgi:Transposase, Mutator family/Type II secretion system protein C